MFCRDDEAFLFTGLEFVDDSGTRDEDAVLVLASGEDTEFETALVEVEAADCAKVLVGVDEVGLLKVQVVDPFCALFDVEVDAAADEVFKLETGDDETAFKEAEAADDCAKVLVDLDEVGLLMVEVVDPFCALFDEVGAAADFEAFNLEIKGGRLSPVVVEDAGDEDECDKILEGFDEVGLLLVDLIAVEVVLDFAHDSKILLFI